MKYSIIVPIWNPDGELTGMIADCLESIRRCSEGEDYEIIEILNTRGFPTAVNQGMKKARGEWLITLNDDVILQDKEWLKKLSSGNYISSWRLHPFFITGRLVPDGACWCMPRNIFERIGFLDEQFSGGYGFEDSDYWMRAEQLRIIFKDAKVKLIHGENVTFQTYFSREKEAMTKKNHELFLAKWKDQLKLA